MRKASVVCGAVNSRLSFHKFKANQLRMTNLGVAASLFVAGLAISVPGASAQQAKHLPTTTQISAASDQTGKPTLTAKVLGGDRGVPTGTVSFTNGPSSLGSILLDENGTAILTTSAAATQQITAVYDGDTTFDPSSSLALALPAASTVPTFTLSATPTTLTVKAGNFVTSTVTITPSNGFIDPVLLSCTGLPVNSTCSFNPTTVTPNGTAPATTPVTAILTIQTTAQSGSIPGNLPGRSSHTPIYAIVLPGLAALSGLSLMRKRTFGAMRNMAMFAILAVSLIGAGLALSACSPRYAYFHHPPNLGPGTALGTFTVMVNGSSANAGTVIIPPAVPIVLTVN